MMGSLTKSLSFQQLEEGRAGQRTVAGLVLHFLRQLRHSQV